MLLLLRQAPLGVRSTKRRHLTAQWTILSHVDCFIQGERLLDFRSCWIVFIHIVGERPGGLPSSPKGSC